MTPYLSALVLFILLLMSAFLVCLVLIQRGKGGGLAGAFGGMGSSSAFGSKAGDVFTRVTMISAGIWIALNMVLVILSNQRTSAWGDTPAPGSLNSSPFTPTPGKNATGDQAPTPPTVAPAGANPFDALSPGNPNAVAPSPLGPGGPPTAPGTSGAATLPIAPAAPGAATPLTPALPAAPPTPKTSEMPDPFPTSPAGAGSTPKS